MAVDKSSVSYMREYLRHTLSLEKNVYVWRNALSDVNCRIDSSKRTKGLGEFIINEVDTKLKKLENRSNDENKITKTSLFCNVKKALFIVAIVVSIISFLAGLILGIITLALNESLDIPISKPLVPLLFAFAGVVVSLLITVPISLAIIMINKPSYNANLEKKLTHDSEEASVRRQKAILEDTKDSIEASIATNLVEHSVLEKKKVEIVGRLKDAEKALEKMYSINVLPYKYRYMAAVATLYEYLATGRCNTIQGHGGLYDTFETEKLRIQQLHALMEMNDNLESIEDSQRMICSEMSQANKTLNSVKSCLSEIEKTNSEIALNTAISADANRRTADAVSWMNRQF